MKPCLDTYNYRGQVFYCILFKGHRSGHDYRSKKSRDYKRVMEKKSE